MLTGPRALIDHTALAHNLGVVRRHAPHSRVWAVIKSDAYGHGMRQVVASLAGADGFAVARVGEGLGLREAGVTAPILVLAGALLAEEVEIAGRLSLELGLHQEEQLVLLERARPVKPLRIWVKVDTGMHRLGLDPEAVPGVLKRLAACAAVVPGSGLMTHLANADDPADALSERQCERLRALAAPGQVLNIGNSAGILAFPASRADWVRPGIMLYGSSPFTGRLAAELDLRPVMTLRTSLISVRRLRRGDRVGYGGTYACPEDMPVGVVAIGYGDGYPRHAAPGTPVLIRGRRAPLVGRVSMDSITIDLRGVPGAVVGDEVTLWGQGLPADEIADHAGTIAYALFCGVTARVKKIHESSEASPQAAG